METRILTSAPRRDRGGGPVSAPPPCWLWIALLPLVLSGCFRDDPELAHVKEITARVRPVSDSGLTLDEQATSQTVVYTLLQAIKDDVRAGHDVAKRKTALDRQFALAAPEEILLRFGRKGETREETLLRVVRAWAPVVSYYVNDFDADRETLSGKMRLTDPLPRANANSGGKTELAKVELVLRDPGEPENDLKRAILRVDLSNESGFWRVCYVGFEPRPMKKKPTSAPTSARSESQ